MATVAHYIYSHYDPEDHDALEIQTGQIPNAQDQLDSAELWQLEASRISKRQHARPPPQFVPATSSYNGWNDKHVDSSKPYGTSNSSFGNNLSGWYRSLTSHTIAARDVSDTMTKTSPNLHTSSSQELIASPVPKSSIRRNKNNWFIMKAIQSEPSSSASNPAPSLAEILARDPPPLPSEEKYTPPVWLEIGPSNKGFGMLQRSGWNEGEPLGPNVPRRRPVKDILPDDEIIPTKSKDKGKGRLKFSSLSCHQQTVEVKMEEFDEISELRNVDVIDLTLSDSDDSSVKAEDGRLEDKDGFTNVGTDVSTSHGGKALLTPIATVLKSDRLGIGLKAKTVGPYKASQKRVTHNAEALAAHVRAAEESRKRMKEHGRGRRGYEKQRRMEEEKRKAMLAFLKS
ncbi:hypothetical protein BYT27DRAFT_7187868 [Phlegmacium glaucopus]|nr:hypothetical protein BYT27DRAFT_7187868 [Phlegmacium glaucopus]